MIDKRVKDLAAAVAGIKDGATVLCAGFGAVGEPVELTEALADLGVKNLTIVANNAGTGDNGIARLIREGRVRKVICSYPRTTDPHVFEAAYKAGRIELELVPQGTLSERMRAASAGIGGFYTPTAAGTKLAAGKETANKCLACHTLENGQPAKIGPNLYGVVGGPAAHMEGFKYSKAMEDKKAAGLTWTFENLDHFLTSPRAFIPGTAMTFAGLPKPTDRANVIAYVNSLSDSPLPMPAPSAAAAAPASAPAAAAPAAPTANAPAAAAPAAPAPAAPAPDAPAKP